MSLAEKSPSQQTGASVWELAGSELRLITRSAGFRTLGVLLAIWTVLALVVMRATDRGLLHVGPATGDTVRDTLEALLFLFAPLIVSGAALRERRLGMDDLVLSKPPSSETLAWGKFLGIFAALLTLVPITMATAWIAEIFLFPPEGALLPLVIGGLRVTPPLLLLTGVTFALALYTGSPVSAGLVIAVEIGAGVGADFLVPALRWELTPYHPAYALLGVTVAAATAGGWQRRREPGRPLPRSWIAGLASLTLALGAGAVAVRTWRGWTFQTDPALQVVESWRGDQPGPLPSAALATLSGNKVRLSDWTGKPIVLVFWSSPGSACEVAALERAWQETAARSVGFLPVCLTDDPGRARDLARAAGLRAPVIWNPPPRFGQSSGLAARFEIEHPPGAAVAARIRADGTAPRNTLPVSQPPQPLEGRPPRPEWEQRLVELGRTAFRQLAERGQ